jgi:hypothetical protein
MALGLKNRVIISGVNFPDCRYLSGTHQTISGFPCFTDIRPTKDYLNPLAKI